MAPEWRSTKTDIHAESVATLSGRDQRKRWIQLIKKKSEHLLFKALSYLIFYFLLFFFIISIFLYSYSYITANEAEVLTTALFSLLLPALAFAYLAHSGKSLNEAAADLGIIQKLRASKIIAIGIVLFLIVLLLELSITLIGDITKISFATNACEAITGMPLWFIFFILVVGPIDEELFFRGFLVKRIGIILSAVLFAVLHAGYGSTFGIDIIAAFVFGIIAGYIFKKTSSIYPSLIGHILVNVIAVLGCL